MLITQRPRRTPRPPRRQRAQRFQWRMAAFHIRFGSGAAGFTDRPYLDVRPDRETAVVSAGRYASVWCAACRVGLWPQQDTPGQREDAAIRWVHDHNTRNHPRRWAREHAQHFQASIPVEVRERAEA